MKEMDNSFKPTIIILINCYNNEQEVIAFTKRLEKINIREKVALSVNVNSLIHMKFDEFEQQVKESFKNSYVFDYGKNYGYYNGLLMAYNGLSALVSISECQYIIMCNTDILIEQIDFFERLLNKKYEEKIGCIAPSVYVPKRKIYENPQRLYRYTRMGIDGRILLFSCPFVFFLYSMLSKVKSNCKKQKKEQCYVYSSHGCFFILTNDFFQKIKEEMYGCLMYSEEAFIAEWIRHYGYKEFYDSDIEVVHFESTVTGFLKNKERSKMFAESLTFIRNKFFC